MSTDISNREIKEVWLPVLSIAAGTFATVTTEFLPVGLLPQISGSLGVSLSHAAWMITIPGLVAAAAPLLLVSVGRMDRRRLLLFLTGLTALSNLLAGLSQNFAVLLVARFLLGICVGGFWAFAANMGRRLVSAPSHNRATAIILAGISAGTVCGLPAGTWVGTVTTWRTAFDINCLLAILVLVVQALSVPSLPADQQARWVQLAAPFRLLEVRTALICTFLIILGYFAGYTYLTPFLMLAFHLLLSSVPVLLLAYGVAGLVGTFIAERLMRQGPRRALLWVSIVLVSAMYLGAHIGFGFVPAMMFAVLIGAAFGALPMALATWMFHATPDHAEAGQVLLVVIFQLAIAVGSAMGGFVVSHGGIAATMTAGAVAVFLGALVSNPLHKAEVLVLAPPAPI